MTDAERLAQLHDHIFRKLRIRHRGPLPFSTPRGTRAQVADLLQDAGFTRGIEIGTWLGDSAKMLCQAVPGVDLTCVDPWTSYRNHDIAATEAVYAHAVETLAPFNATILRTTSMDAANRFPDGHFDFANIDGDHAFDYVCQDLIVWSRKVKRNGIIMAHDYDAHVPGVVWAVNAYTHCHCINPWYVTQEVRHPVTAFWINP